MQLIDEELALSQKFNELSTSLSSNNKVKENIQINGLEKIPDYLTKSDKSLQHVLGSLFPMDTINANKLEDFRQMAIFIHHIKYNEILYSLWNVYLKSGLGELKPHNHSRHTLNIQMWPMPVKLRVKVNISSDNKKHDTCLTYVKKRLMELEKNIKQSQSNLYDQINRLSSFSSSFIRQTIEKFVEDRLINLRQNIEHKIQLVNYDYDEEILRLQYLQHNPNEAQVR